MKAGLPITVTDTLLTYSNVADDATALWLNPSTYALNDMVQHNHRLYKSKQAVNQGHEPGLTDSYAWWADQGPVNKWALFDLVSTTKTTNTGSIVSRVVLGAYVNSIALINVNGASVRVKMTDPIEGVVWDETHSLIATYNVYDPYTFCFKPIKRARDKVITGLPLYLNAEIEVTIEGGTAGESVSCGTLAFAFVEKFGATQYGARSGTRDFSIKEQNDFGDHVLVERAYSKWNDLTIWVDAEAIDNFKSEMDDWRAKPAIYIGSDNYSSLLVYGFYKDTAVEFTHATVCVCTMRIEGLI